MNNINFTQFQNLFSLKNSNSNFHSEAEIIINKQHYYINNLKTYQSYLLKILDLVRNNYKNNKLPNFEAYLTVIINNKNITAHINSNLQITKIYNSQFLNAA